MKALVSLLAVFALSGNVSAQGPAVPDDRALCQGDYPVLLMTERECSHYASQMRALTQGGDAGALAALVVEHDVLLSERASACPCITAGAAAGDC